MNLTEVGIITLSVLRLTRSPGLRKASTIDSHARAMPSPPQIARKWVMEAATHHGKGRRFF